MTPTITEFRTQFPELSTITDAAITTNLTLAAHIHDISKLATLYLAAHLATIPTDGETPGEIVSEDIGPKSAEYSTQASEGDDAFFTRTEYGKRYLVLAKRVTSGPFRVRVI